VYKLPHPGARTARAPEWGTRIQIRYRDLLRGGFYWWFGWAGENFNGRFLAFGKGFRYGVSAVANAGYIIG
jgi:hypothetical protein